MATYFFTGATSGDPSVGSNWTKADGSTGTVPANGDDVYIQSVPGVSLPNITAVDQHSIALNSLTISSTFTGTIGTNAAPGGYWQIGAATVNIGLPAGDGSNPGGSGRIKVNLGSTSAVVNITSTVNSSADAGYEPVRLLGSAITVLNSLSGTVGVATNAPGETATVGIVNVTAGTCNLGSGVTWTTVNVSNGGSITTNSGGTTVSVASGGNATLNGATIVTTVNTSGTVVHNVRPGSGAGTTTFNVYNGGTADFSNNPAAVTVTTLNQYPTAIVKANPSNSGHLTITNRNLIECGTLTAS